MIYLGGRVTISAEMLEVLFCPACLWLPQVFEHIIFLLNQHVCPCISCCPLNLGCRHTKKAVHGNSLLPAIVSSSASFAGSSCFSVDVSETFLWTSPSQRVWKHLIVSGMTHRYLADVIPEIRHPPPFLCVGPVLMQMSACTHTLLK